MIHGNEKIVGNMVKIHVIRKVLDIIDFDEECGATLEIPNQDNVWVIQLNVTPQDGYYTGREYSLSISDIPGTALNWR